MSHRVLRRSTPLPSTGPGRRQADAPGTRVKAARCEMPAISRIRLGRASYTAGMSSPDGSGDRSIRASDAERTEIARRLTDAVGDGRLTLAEFTERVDAAYQSVTRGELDALVTDLPATASDRPVEPTDGTKRRWKLAIMGGSDYKGRWRVPRKSGYFALMGGSTIDLREATLPGPEIEIMLVSIMGGSDVIVPRGVRVVVDSTDIMGGNTIKVDEEAEMPNAPLIRIRSFSIMGGNDIRHPKRKKRFWSD
ncbi:cell wall-active antibiotic response 4TMS protein YvqF [Saccharopolyspora spinosa]|uniref:Cell wall-active antibiotic response 4TMS protein YvqF n=2 Tax=Saccharopolyspora spinosa TaxID=60894 RepID=A0A2N3XSQ0_SACSN|nr:cell wall-active antibiotic response 4TMS protein YvqF [Saccharopolyspora spinosa]